MRKRDEMKRKSERDTLYSGNPSKKLILEYQKLNLNYSVVERLDLETLNDWELIIIKSDIYYHC